MTDEMTIFARALYRCPAVERKRPGCNPNGLEPHACPYQLEVNETTVLCTCCEACTQECRDEI